MTLLQIMKLVIGCAFASAFALPLVRLAEARIASRAAMLAVGAIGIPLVFALTAMVLAGRGASKDRLIRLLCSTSAAVAFGVGITAFGRAATAWMRSGGSLDPRWLGTLAVLGLPTLVFGVILWLLMRKVVAAEFLASRAAVPGESNASEHGPPRPK